MLGYVTSHIRHQAGRAVTLGLGILVAAVSFVLLTGSTRSSQLLVRGTVESSFRTAYDVLVRPKGSATPLERTDGLVRSNYLSGLYGGITFAQYRTIRRVPGVEVAAPIANIGTILPLGLIRFPLRPFLTTDRHQLYKITFSWVSDGDTSRVPDSAEYVYYTRNPLVRYPPGTRFSLVNEAVPGGKTPLPVCTGFGATAPPDRGPFQRAPTLGCSSLRTPPGIEKVFGPYFFRPYAGWGFSFPIAFAAIDPVQEARLLDLDKTIESGRYLRDDEGLKETDVKHLVPVLASTRAYLGDTLVASIARVELPRGVDVPRWLATGACTVPDYPCEPDNIVSPPRGAPPGATAYSFVRGLKATEIARRTFSATTAYQAVLGGDGNLFSDAYWTAAPVRYRQIGPETLAPIPTTNPVSMWKTTTGAYRAAPPQNQDVQFRRLRATFGDEHTGADGRQLIPGFELVGRFDPAKLPGFSPLTRVPLETYYPPVLNAADTASRRALAGQPFLPSQNLGGYVQQPPLFLTTLRGLRALRPRDQVRERAPGKHRAGSCGCR